jgi:CRISPR-associated protein Csd1
MILRQLVDLYERLEKDPNYRIARMGFSLQKISFKVVLKPDGTLFAIQDARQKVSNRLVPTQIMVPGGAKPSGQGLNPCFLWDNAKYMLGFTAGDDQDRTARSFEAFRQRHLDARSQIESKSYGAVCSFLKQWQPVRANEHSVLTDLGQGFGVFQIQGELSFVHDDAQVLTWWANQSQDSWEVVAECLVTGRLGPVARIHDKIKGVAHAKSFGGSIVGFNEPAYESYGAQQSYNAPVGRAAAFRYVTALNALLDGPMRDKHRLQIGDSTIAFWTDVPTIVEDVVAVFLMQGSRAIASDQVQDETMRRKLVSYLNSLRRGRGETFGLEEASDTVGYNLVGFAPNEARISVRFHLHGTLQQFLDNQRAHFRDIEIESNRRIDSSLDEFPSIGRLLDETCPWIKGKPDRDRISPIFIGPLLRAIIHGRHYPEGFYNAVMRRLRADRAMRRVRAGIIKGYLIRNRGKEVSMSLDTQNPAVAYRLGRLFSALEKTQADALGGELNATIRDRFYGAASATPRTVFPRLLRTYQHHLAKLQPGLRVNREKLIQEILDPLEGFPTWFDLTDQGLFAIGYYHQTAAFYRKSEHSTSEERTDS